MSLSGIFQRTGKSWRMRRRDGDGKAEEARERTVWCCIDELRGTKYFLIFESTTQSA